MCSDHWSVERSDNIIMISLFYSRRALYRVLSFERIYVIVFAQYYWPVSLSRRVYRNTEWVSISLGGVNVRLTIRGNTRKLQELERNKDRFWKRGMIERKYAYMTSKCECILSTASLSRLRRGVLRKRTKENR